MLFTFYRRNRLTLRKTLVIPRIEKQITKIAEAHHKKIENEQINPTSLQGLAAQFNGGRVSKMDDDDMNEEDEVDERDAHKTPAIGENVVSSSMRRDSKQSKTMFVVQKKKVVVNKRPPSNKEMVWFN